MAMFFVFFGIIGFICALVFLTDASEKHQIFFCLSVLALSILLFFIPAYKGNELLYSCVESEKVEEFDNIKFSKPVILNKIVKKYHWWTYTYVGNNNKYFIEEIK